MYLPFLTQFLWRLACILCATSATRETLEQSQFLIVQSLKTSHIKIQNLKEGRKDAGAVYHAHGTNEITCSLLVLPDTMQITLRKEPVSQIAVPFEYCALYVFFWGGGGTETTFCKRGLTHGNCTTRITMRSVNSTICLHESSIEKHCFCETSGHTWHSNCNLWYSLRCLADDSIVVLV